MIPMNPTPSIALENRMLRRFSGLKNRVRLKPNSMSALARYQQVTGKARVRDEDSSENCYPFYSPRSASIGSTLAARRAGSTAASKATAASIAVVVPRTSGLHASTPKSSAVIRWPAAMAAGRPMSSPRPTCRKAPRSTISCTWARLAPSAMRMPISLVRCATAYAVTP